MQDKGLVVALVIQAGLQTATASAALSDLAPRPVVSGVGLLAAVFASCTAAYVAATKDPSVNSARRLDREPVAADDGASGTAPTPRR